MKFCAFDKFKQATRLVLLAFCFIGSAAGAGEAPERDWSCKIRLSLYGNAGYLYLYGQDAWSGTGMMVCRRNGQPLHVSVTRIKGTLVDHGTPEGNSDSENRILLYSDPLYVADPSDLFASRTARNVDKQKFAFLGRFFVPVPRIFEDRIGFHLFALSDVMYNRYLKMDLVELSIEPTNEEVEQEMMPEW